MRFITLALLFLPLSAAADNALEINAVRDRARTFQAEAEDQLGKLRRFNTASRELSWRSQELAAALSVTKALPPARTRLQALAREQVFVDVAWESLERHEEKIFSYLQQADRAAALLPEISAAHRTYREGLERGMRGLRDDLVRRRAQAARDRELWLEEQREETMRGIAEGRLRAVDELKFKEKMRNAQAAFAAVRRAFLRAGTLGKRADAERLLLGYRWLRSVLPLYLPISSPERAEAFRLLRGSVEEVEAKMADELTRLPRDERSFAPFASLRLSSKPKPKVPENEPLPQIRGRYEKDPEGRGWIFFDRSEDGGHTWRTVELVQADGPRHLDDSRPDGGFQEGFVRGKTDSKEFRAAPKEAELRQRQKKENSERIRRAEHKANPRPEPPRSPEVKPEPSLREQTRELRELVRRAENDAEEEDEQAEVRELVAEVSRYEALQDYYGAELDSESMELGNIRASTALLPAAIATVPPAPAKLEPGSHGSEELAIELGKAIADSALGLIPGYDFANFAYAMATGHTFFGDEVSGDELKLMGVVAVIGVIPGGAVAANTLKSLNRLKKVAPGAAKALGHATRNLAPELARLSPDLVRVGKGEKFVLIGRHMGDSGPPGVKQLAADLRKNGLDVEIFKPSKAAQEAWDREAAKKPSGWLTDEDIPHTEVFKENQEFMDRNIRDENHFLHMGDPYGKGDSVPTKMENDKLNVRLGEHFKGERK